MYICLMRHGKAEPYGLDKIDKDRLLVERGEKQSDAMAAFAARWWPEGKTVLWCSPYTRACQTAAYAKKHLPIAEFHTHQAIADGDLQRLYDEVLSKETADIVFVVGHSPYIDDWAERWTGTRVDFKTACLALFEYDPYGGPVGTGKLLLYVHPKSLPFIHT